jgi:hypothetical protein
MSNRAKLETAIEREVFKFVREIKEHVFDHTMLYVRRNNLDIDGQVLRVVLDIVDKAVLDGYQREVDRFMSNLDKSLSQFSDEENPLPSTDE